MLPKCKIWHFNSAKKEKEMEKETKLMKLALNLTESLDSILSRKFHTFIIYLEHEFTLNAEISLVLLKQSVQ